MKKNEFKYPYNNPQIRKERIGLITFHWAINYGAILQAFSLQQFLLNHGYYSEIINYVPKKILLKDRISRIRRFSISETIKEFRFIQFRNSYLKITKTRYKTNRQLKNKCQNFSHYICGSDQIWNEWFIYNSENKPNLTYYLDFVKEDVYRISYAASFGTSSLSNRTKSIIQSELEKFSMISVRENSGKKIIDGLNLESEVVVDPTLLIDKSVYDNMISDLKDKETFDIFLFTLHGEDKKGAYVCREISRDLFRDTAKIYKRKSDSIKRWIYSIKNSKIVITNSFHCLMFALIYHKPFIVLPVEGNEINDRISTVLKIINQTERCLLANMDNKIALLIQEKIDWNFVDSQISIQRQKSIDLLLQSLENTR